MKIKIKLNHYITFFFLLLMTVIVIGDAVKFQNYRNTLIQNYSNKYIHITEQIREDYRLLFDRLQYDFDKSESVNIEKLNQLYKIYKRDRTHFNVDKAAEELNKDVHFGSYEVFLINKNYIIEDASYKTDIGLNFGNVMEIKELMSSIFTKKLAIDISSIILDVITPSSMPFKRYFIKLSNDEKYILQLAFVLDFARELEVKHDVIKNVGLVELYLGNDSIQKLEFDKRNHSKKFLQLEGWEATKNILFQLSNVLSIKNKRLEALTKLDLKDLINHQRHVHEIIDEVFRDNNLLSSLNLSQHNFTIYAITNGMFNKSTKTKLLVKTIYSTESLESDIQKTFIQAVIQLFFILSILVLIYFFIMRSISHKLLKIINNIKNNHYSDVSNIKIKEIAVLNESYNGLHTRLNKEIELNKTKERYQQALIDNFPFVIWLKDTESRFLAVNQVLATRYAEENPAKMIGKTDFDYSPKKLAEHYRLDDREILESKQQKNLEEEIVNNFGESIWVETYKAPVFDDRGHALGTVGFARDITERKKTEEKLKQLLEQERQSRQEQSQFMAMLAHELKTPLAVIRMVLGSKTISPDMLFHSKRAVMDMNNVIERCLQSEKLADAQMPIRKISCSPLTLINDLCNQFNSFDRFVIDAQTQSLINTDEQLLHTVLSNLIDNALKYSQPKSLIHIDIAENKKGISIAFQNAIGAASYPDPENVFQKYYRHKAAHHKTGSGLGLYLVKTISQLLGGDIFYDHNTTHITFTLWLPL